MHAQHDAALKCSTGLKVICIEMAVKIITPQMDLDKGVGLLFDVLDLEIKRLRTKLEPFTFIFILRMNDSLDRIQIQTLFTLFFLMKSRLLVENSTGSSFESQKIVNFQHIYSQKVWTMFVQKKKVFQ